MLKAYLEFDEETEYRAEEEEEERESYYSWADDEADRRMVEDY